MPGNPRKRSSDNDEPLKLVQEAKAVMERAVTPVEDLFPGTDFQLLLDEKSRQLHTPKSIFLPSMLSTTAHLMNNSKVEWTDSWVEVPNIYCVSVASPGVGKTPAGKVFVDGVRKLERDMMDKAKAEMEDEEKEFDMMSHQRIMCGITPEAMMRVMAANEGSCLLICDEFKGFYDKMMSTGCLESNIIQAFSNEPFRYTTNQWGCVDVPNPLLSIFANVQPEALLEMLKSTNDFQGFFDRLILIPVIGLDPPETVQDYEAADAPLDERVQNYKILHLQEDIDELHSEPKTYMFSEDAKSEVTKQRIAMDRIGRQRPGTEGACRKGVAKLIRLSAVACALRGAIERKESGDKEASFLIQLEDVNVASSIVHYSNNALFEFKFPNPIDDIPPAPVDPNEVGRTYVLRAAGSVDLLYKKMNEEQGLAEGRITGQMKLCPLKKYGYTSKHFVQALVKFRLVTVVESTTGNNRATRKFGPVTNTEDNEVTDLFKDLREELRKRNIDFNPLGLD